MTDKMTTIDTTNMCSHLQRKLFDANGEYHKIWLALQDDPELTAVVRSRQLHIYRNGKKVLVLAGKSAPKIIKVKYEIPQGSKLGWHHHDAMNHGVLVQGELTIVAIDGTEKVVHEGEAVVEMVGTVHHGENRSTKPVVLYMFYLSQKGMPLSVPHSEIPTK